MHSDSPFRNQPFDMEEFSFQTADPRIEVWDETKQVTSLVEILAAEYVTVQYMCEFVLTRTSRTSQTDSKLGFLKWLKGLGVEDQSFQDEFFGRLVSSILFRHLSRGERNSLLEAAKQKLLSFFASNSEALCLLESPDPSSKIANMRSSLRGRRSVISFEDTSLLAASKTRAVVCFSGGAYVGHVYLYPPRDRLYGDRTKELVMMKGIRSSVWNMLFKLTASPHAVENVTKLLLDGVKLAVKQDSKHGMRHVRILADAPFGPMPLILWNDAWKGDSGKKPEPIRRMGSECFSCVIEL